MAAMTKRERMDAVFAGKEVDRPPFSLWYHFGLQHGPGYEFARAQRDFYDAYNLDWLKVMSDYPYPFPVGISDCSTPENLMKLDRFEIEDSPYQEQLAAWDVLSREIGDDTLCIDTVFNPWNIARRSLVKEKMPQYMRDDPRALHHALEVITENMIAYCRSVIEHGADGLFISVPASAEFLTYEEYQTFMKPYDLKLFQAVKAFAPVVIAHIHGNALYFSDIVRTYQTDAISWADRAAGPGLAEARQVYDGVLMGGIDHADFASTSLSALQAQAREAIEVGGKQRFILAPGCSIPTDTFPEIIRGVCASAGIDCEDRPLRIPY